jgi:hypothetical protein
MDQDHSYFVNYSFHFSGEVFSMFNGMAFAFKIISECVCL